MDSIEHLAWQALHEADPAAKCSRVTALATAWTGGAAPSVPLAQPERLGTPGRPALPRLVAPDAVPRRSPFTPDGHAALLHAVAHIEFNAVNLALDCLYRFSAAGSDFVDDWARVAAEEARHFGLLSARLALLGRAYGDFDAHNGLWEMAVKTDHDFLARMALVPRLLEARGLDATPLIQAKLRKMGDQASLDILDVILRDEVGHVAIGDRWYRHACRERGLEAEAAFRRLLATFEAAVPRPPLNREARLRAGFSAAELDAFERRAQR